MCYLTCLVSLVPTTSLSHYISAILYLFLPTAIANTPYSHIVNKTVFGIKVFLTSYICIEQKSLMFGAGLYPNTAVLLIAAKDLNILFLAHCAKSLKITTQSHACYRHKTHCQDEGRTQSVCWIKVKVVKWCTKSEMSII